MRPTTVCTPGWHVSYMCSPGAPVRLQVSRADSPLFREGRQWRVWHGDHNGRTFTSDIAADRFAYDHGYIMSYYERTAAVRKKNRRFLRLVMDAARAALIDCRSKAEVAALADAVKRG